MSAETYFSLIDAGELDALQTMLGETPDALQLRDEEQRTGLHRAIEAEQTEVACWLIEAGTDIEARNSGGRAPLHDAIEHGIGEVCELLIERGAEIDVCSAAILGALERLEELLDADPELANDRSTELSPLGWAAFGNRVDSAELLIQRGALMDDGELLCAALVGHVEIGKFLIEHGADPNEIHDGPDANALHAACVLRYTHDTSEFVQMLLDSGADPSIPAGNGKTALEIARVHQGRSEDPSRRFDLVIELLQ